MMRLLGLVCVALYFSASNCQDQTDAEITRICEDSSIATCDQCIKAHPQCAWCAVAQSGSQIKRCRRMGKLLQLNECPAALIQFPRSETILNRNVELSVAGTDYVENNVVQLQPQNLTIKLRRGDSVKFNVTFRKVTDYPVDLYYVMDLSHSMMDDLATLKRLGQRLADDIKNNITQNIQMGFGTFVDKVMMPFASTVPEQLENPCAKNTGDPVCAPPFGFKHQQSISSNLDNFRSSVENTSISGNIDSPEGGFDALMQIAVCGEEIGWREDATHLIVFTTDASFHMALDGKLAAILEANDMKCHLRRGANPYLPNAIVYDKSQEQDYPSIGQLSAVCKENKMQPIFAVTKEVRGLYEGLKDLIPNSFVDELENDSSNIIEIISTAYNQLKEKLDMSLDDNKPTEVDLSYRVLCPSNPDWIDNSLSCDQIRIGSEVVYEFTATAINCPEIKPTVPLIFTSSSLREEVSIYFDFLCGCDCSDTPTPNSANCSTNGSLVCGVCECDVGHEGARCQCQRDQVEVSLVESCKKPGSADVCEGQGTCECGECVCNEGYGNFAVSASADDKEYCECSNKGCSNAGNGALCGGSDQGTCVNCGNPECICRNGWTNNEQDGTCTCRDSLCMAPNDTELCSGKGVCECHTCACYNESTIYSGKYCNECISPKCRPVVGCTEQNYQECAFCINQAHQNRETQFDKVCQEDCVGIDYATTVSITDCGGCGNNCPSVCSDIDSDIFPPEDCSSKSLRGDCSISYQVVWRKTTNNFQLLVKTLDPETDCDKGTNPLFIVLPIVAGIVLFGLIALIAWKIYQTMRDKREWLSFENEMKQSKWTKDINPVFQKPTSRFENPSYGGDEQ